MLAGAGASGARAVGSGAATVGVAVALGGRHVDMVWTGLGEGCVCSGE